MKELVQYPMCFCGANWWSEGKALCCSASVPKGKVKYKFVENMLVRVDMSEGCKATAVLQGRRL